MDKIEPREKKYKNYLRINIKIEEILENQDQEGAESDPSIYFFSTSMAPGSTCW
jgi:hypothetical protein